ncbi:hypothetical protein JVU11DRAFT_9290 [Chiua virens]|nr:hypothetical protein JVU11DRAFT_9290 [Chiua virens]
MANPHLEVEPDYILPEFADARLIFTVEGKTDAQAAALLREVWRFNHQKACETWDQVRQAEEEEEEERLARQAEQRQINQEQEKQLALQEERKKYKYEYLPIPDRPLPSHDTFIPPQHAINKLKKGEHVPPYYFTNRGIQEAEEEAPNLDDDVLTLTRMDEGGPIWQSSAAVKAKACKVPDENLTWEEFSEATYCMLHWMTLQDRPRQRTDMTGKFWLALQGHTFRHGQCEYGKKALLVYQARIRRQWHQTIATPEVFSLMPLNEYRPITIQKELRDVAVNNQIETLRKLNAQAAVTVSNSTYAPKQAHTRSFSASKCPLSLSSSQRGHHANKKGPFLSCRPPQPNPAAKTGDPSGASYPVCAVCLGREKHDVPVITCRAKKTWDNAFDTLCERIKDALVHGKQDPRTPYKLAAWEQVVHLIAHPLPFTRANSIRS